MVVSESSIVPVLSEASARMADPSYVSDEVGRLRLTQPAVTQYVLAHEKELALDGVVTVLFNVTLIIEAIRRATGRTPARLSYPSLDVAARAAPTLEALAAVEADLASFIASNVELDRGRSPLAQAMLAHVARALVG
jgi:hypothetical protein